MTLTFLGQRYEAIATEVPVTESKFTGKYRGVPMKFSQARTVTRSPMSLTYRGVNYQG